MNKMWFIYLQAMSLSLRAVLFEKYTLAINLFWWGLFLVLLGLVSSLHWSFPLVVVLVFLVAYRSFFIFMIQKKYFLIRSGDRVEYTPLESDDTVMQSDLFKTTMVLRLMKQDEVKLSGGFDKEYLVYYEFFYLCEDKNKKLFIPLEWILRIETEL